MPLLLHGFSMPLLLPVFLSIAAVSAQLLLNFSNRWLMCRHGASDGDVAIGRRCCAVFSIDGCCVRAIDRFRVGVLQAMATVPSAVAAA